jgi:hypothetical protein
MIWRPISVTVLKKDEGRKLKPSDAPRLGIDAIVLSEKARSVLSPIIGSCGELLRLDCQEASFDILNVTRFVNALKETESDVVRFKSGRIMRILKHKFDETKLAGEVFFKIPNVSASSIYCTEEVVKLWAGAGLRGLDFECVWP